MTTAPERPAKPAPEPEASDYCGYCAGWLTIWCPHCGGFDGCAWCKGSCKVPCPTCSGGRWDRIQWS